LQSIALLLCSLSGVAAIDAESVAQNAAALFGDAPSVGTRDFDDQAAHVESLQRPADSGAVAMAILGRVAVQGDAEVLVAKALGDVVAGQNGSEQLGLRFAGWIEVRITVSLVTVAFRQRSQILVGGSRIVHWRQRLQVTQVARQGMALIVMKIAYPF